MADDEEFPWPRAQEASEYLQKHKVLELFNNMTSKLIYERPENPKEFLIKELEELRKARSSEADHPCLFDESNIQSVFSMLDPTGRGYITAQQYKEALRTLGVKEFDEEPSGAESDRISYQTFQTQAEAGLTRMSSTYNQ